MTDLQLPAELHLPDIQAARPERLYRLSRVGVRGVRKPVVVARPGRDVTLNTEFDIFVDLPAEQKGVHMSRNLEAVAELLDERLERPVESLERFVSRLAEILLERHGYAQDSDVRAVADYFLPREFGGAKSVERYRLFAEGRAVRGQDGRPTVRKLIGVEVVGMTACPCAMETSRRLLAARGVDHPEAGPTITHNQRNVTTLLVEVPSEHEVEADDLVDLVESSLSAPTFEILKRRMEGELVMRAHDKPMFVEDVVREVLDKVKTDYARLPDDTHVIVRSEAMESIHKHNAYAERVTTLAELRRSPPGPVD